MKLQEASALANQIVLSIEHLCDPEHVVVVGSVRRKRPEVHDIDIVLIPQSWMWNTISNILKNELSAQIVEAGQELARLKVPRISSENVRGWLQKERQDLLAVIDAHPVQVDLYRARPETWGVLLLIRTGSIQHNIKLCSLARQKGMMLSAAKGVIKDGKVIASRTEEEIFKALGIDFVEPEKREV